MSLLKIMFSIEFQEVVLRIDMNVVHLYIEAKVLVVILEVD